MIAPKLVAAATLSALALSGCADAERRAGADTRICTPFAEAARANAEPTQPGQLGPATPAVATDPAAALDDCLHRWGYTLAASSDRALDVAQAVVAACTPALTRWNQQTLTAAAAPGQMSGAMEAPSLLTGQPTTPIAEHYNYAQARALFYVVQGRAGKCAPPPARRETEKTTR